MSKKKEKHLETHGVQIGEERGVELSTAGNEGRSTTESLATKNPIILYHGRPHTNKTQMAHLTEKAMEKADMA